jgi:hypothetical protein
MIIGQMLIAHADAAHAKSRPEPLSIVVRVYDGARLSPAERERAIHVANVILEAASIGVDWRYCDDPSAHENNACARPLAADEFALRFVAEPTTTNVGEDPDAGRAHAAKTPSDGALGYSLIDMQLRRGSLATVYPERVSWLAAATGVEAALLMGRAIAHEVGHLLLGTNEHRTAGIMRAVWSRKALRRETAADWTFTARDASDMAASIRRRAEVATSIVWSTR